ncbi:MAG: putative tryptophan/tyrosine transport system substrate-binding protein [Candidatus Dependentiae bacterium]|nr:putative tryptophan/tyrosine transport system substrate-binding protein [Candidatus Dependentiae bacterium]
MATPLYTGFSVPTEKLRGPRIAILSRAMFSYHSKVVMGFLRKVEEQTGLNWRPIMFFCKEPRVDVMIEQMKEIREDKYDLVLAIGALYSAIAAEHVREGQFNIPLVFCGVTDPVQMGILSSLQPQALVTGIVREQIPSTYLADFLPMMRPTMKRVLIPHYPNAEFGLHDERLKRLKERFSQQGIEAILLPTITMDDVLPGVLQYIGGIDTIIVPEGTFVTDLIPALAKLCRQYKVMLVAHTVEYGNANPAITFTQKVELIGQELFHMAHKILVDGKKPLELPIVTLPNDRKIVVDINACHEQGVDVDAIALFCANDNIIIR